MCYLELGAVATIALYFVMGVIVIGLVITVVAMFVVVIREELYCGKDVNPEKREFKLFWWK